MAVRKLDRSKSNPPATLVGTALREARERRKLGQGAIASLLGMKDPKRSGQALISNWECGRAIIKPTPAQTAVLAQLLGISRESLAEKLAADDAARKTWRERKSASGVCRDLPKAPDPSTVEVARAAAPTHVIPVIVWVLPRPASMRNVAAAELVQYIEDVIRVRDEVASMARK